MGAQSKPKAAASSSRGGGIAKRRSAARTDRDGDVSMDTTARARGGGVSKGKAKGTASKAAAGNNAHAQTERGGRPSRLNSERAQREIMKHVGDAPRRGGASLGNRMNHQIHPLAQYSTTG